MRGGEGEEVCPLSFVSPSPSTASPPLRPSMWLAGGEEVDLLPPEAGAERADPAVEGREQDGGAGNGTLVITQDSDLAVGTVVLHVLKDRAHTRSQKTLVGYAAARSAWRETGRTHNNSERANGVCVSYKDATDLLFLGRPDVQGLQLGLQDDRRIVGTEHLGGQPRHELCQGSVQARGCDGVKVTGEGWPGKTPTSTGSTPPPSSAHSPACNHSW